MRQDALDIVHPCTGKGILVPNALATACKAKIIKHTWLGARGLAFTPFVCTTLGDASNDSYLALHLFSLPRAEAQDKAALAAAR
jgi:hypothetical protein